MTAMRLYGLVWLLVLGSCHKCLEVKNVATRQMNYVWFTNAKIGQFQIIRGAVIGEPIPADMPTAASYESLKASDIVGIYRTSADMEIRFMDYRGQWYWYEVPR